MEIRCHRLQRMWALHIGYLSKGVRHRILPACMLALLGVWWVKGYFTWEKHMRVYASLALLFMVVFFLPVIIKPFLRRSKLVEEDRSQSPETV